MASFPVGAGQYDFGLCNNAAELILYSQPKGTVIGLSSGGESNNSKATAVRIATPSEMAAQRRRASSPCSSTSSWYFVVTLSGISWMSLSGWP